MDSFPAMQASSPRRRRAARGRNPVACRLLCDADALLADATSLPAAFLPAMSRLLPSPAGVLCPLSPLLHRLASSLLLYHRTVPSSSASTVAASSSNAQSRSSRGPVGKARSWSGVSSEEAAACLPRRVHLRSWRWQLQQGRESHAAAAAPTPRRRRRGLCRQQEPCRAPRRPTPTHQASLFIRQLCSSSHIFLDYFQLLAASSQSLRQFHPLWLMASSETSKLDFSIFTDHVTIFELNQRIKKSEENLILLQDLNYALKRFEADGQLEAMFSGVRVIDIQGCCVRLSLKTYIPNIDNIILRHKLDFVEPPMSEHEMLVEFSERNMDIKSMEIFPGDVCIEGIVDTIKSSRNCASTVSSLRWLIIQVQHCIILCMLRRLLVIDANKSRHSFEHSDGDDTVIAHLVGGIDAFIKLAHDWPISSYPLKLLSIKNRDDQSQSITLSFLCKVKDRANSLDTQSRLQLAKFADAIEEILQEMQSGLHSNNITT